MSVRKLALGLLILCHSLPAQAAPLPRYGTFIFSGLCQDPQNRRMIGSRLTLVRRNQGDEAYYEWSELFEPGKIIPPFPGQKKPSAFGKNIALGLYGAAAATVRIGPSGNVAADFDPGSRPLQRIVAGELSEDGLSLSGYEARIWLPRQRDLGAKIPVCDFRPPPK